MGRHKGDQICKGCGCELTPANKAGRLLKCKPCFNASQKAYNKEYNATKRDNNKPIVHLQRDVFVLNSY